MLTEEQVIDVINKTLNLNLTINSVPRNEPLKTLGIDSLDFFNVLMELEGVTGRKVPDDEVDYLVSIKDISDYFSRTLE